MSDRDMCEWETNRIIGHFIKSVDDAETWRSKYPNTHLSYPEEEHAGQKIRHLLAQGVAKDRMIYTRMKGSHFIFIRDE